ncbi:MAG TPA: putative glycolipid-binding domain-containing protein [Patescibacteria group bacterium]|nr:putative glycolipid-binding domain-containing protein [Patescibacteria group bacterium]
MSALVARWQSWDSTGIEHLVLREGSREIVAESVVVASVQHLKFAIRYRVRCDKSWRVRSAEIALVGSDRKIEIAGDGKGNWTDASGKRLPKLAGAIDIDLSVTPFTNTLPIRRLKLQPRQSAEIVTVYIVAPALTLATDPQRYTRLGERRYRYESLDSDFARDIEVDRRGLVVTYPGLFRRLL